jgi:hypothetical protein
MKETSRRYMRIDAITTFGGRSNCLTRGTQINGRNQRAASGEGASFLFGK